MEQRDGGNMETKRKQLASVEMDALRRSCRVSRIEIIRNETIRDMKKVKETILDDLPKYN